jgi:hypothetical protein
VGGTATGGSGGSTTGGTASDGGTSTGGGDATGGGDGTGGAAELNGDTLLGVDGKFWPFRAKSSADTGSSKYWLVNAPDEACPAEGFSIVEEYTAMGDPTQQYTVQFEIRGALALRCFENGTPTGMTADANGVNEALYMGGEPSGTSMTNVIALTVSPDVATAEANTYYLNGIPASSGTCDEGITYDVQYKGSFVIMGDSKVTLSFNAPECQTLQNCGADAATCAPREIDTDGIEVRASSPQPVSDVFFVDDTQVDLYPQWLIFDIQDITTP